MKMRRKRGLSDFISSKRPLLKWSTGASETKEQMETCAFSWGGKIRWKEKNEVKEACFEEMRRYVTTHGQNKRPLMFFFRCAVASLYEVVSVRPSVCPSVRPSVRRSVPCYFRRSKVRLLGASCAVYPALFSWSFTARRRSYVA